MKTLSKAQIETIKTDKKISIITRVRNQLVCQTYRENMIDLVIGEEDIAEEIISEISEGLNCEGWDDSELLDWIREIQYGLIEDFASSASVSLEMYISDKFDSQSEFAEKQGVKPPQITQWIKKGFVVIDDVLYSPRRELNT